MKKELTTINQNSKLALERSKNLLKVTSKILENKMDTNIKIVSHFENITQYIPQITYKKLDLVDSFISKQQNIVIELDDGIKAWLDEDTGLMWEIKNETNINYKYIWSIEFIQGAWFPTQLTDTIKDAHTYVDELNKKHYAGYNDWRIPTKEELKTLISQELHNNFNIKFPLIKNTIADAYWASDYHKDSNRINPFIVFFVRGSCTYYPPAAHFPVRCVRGKYAFKTISTIRKELDFIKIT